MNAIAVQNILIAGVSVGKEASLRKQERFWSFGLSVLSTLGAFSGIGGLAVSSLSLFGLIDPHSGLSTAGSMLVAASFPLFFLAAHCLDKASDANKAVRLENYRSRGCEAAF